MATSKKAAKKEAAKKSDKIHRRKKGIQTGDPIIITGGSMMVEFDPDFDDDDAAPSMGHKKIKKISHPVSTRQIKGLEVTDRSGNLLLSYRLPASLNGRCKIFIKDR